MIPEILLMIAASIATMNSAPTTGGRTSTDITVEAISGFDMNGYIEWTAIAPAATEIPMIAWKTNATPMASFTVLLSRKVYILASSYGATAMERPKAAP